MSKYVPISDDQTLELLSLVKNRMNTLEFENVYNELYEELKEDREDNPGRDGPTFREHRS